MNHPENICPNCKEKNDLEAVVCTHCGAVLEDPFLDPGFKTKQTNFPALVQGHVIDWPVDEAAAPQQGIAVYIEGEFKPVHIDSSGEFVIGRKVGETSELPHDFLDLSPLGGYSQGVSKRHVVIRQAEQGYEILDLGSVNGTWLNDKRLVPQRYYPLASGSHFRLGSMRLYAIYRPIPEARL